MAKKKKKTVAPPPRLPAGCVAVDTHCHLDMYPTSEQRDAVVENARRAGVGLLLTIGIDPDSSDRAVSLARQYEEVHAAVGVHPHNVTSLPDDAYHRLRELAAGPEVVAYGEIGLDYVKGGASPSRQLAHFRRQVELARELGLPLIIHDREAHEDIMSVLREAAPFPAGGVMHCFSGDSRLAAEARELGFSISIPGVVTFNKAETLREVVRTTPLNALLLETDAPFLAPVPHRGRRNEPAYLLYTAERIAVLKELPLPDVVAVTTANARRLFGLSAGGDT